MNIVRTVVVVVALAAAAGAAWWLHNRPAAGTGVQVAGQAPGKVQRMRLEDDAQAVGSLRANQSVVVRPEVSGRIVKLGFADGARVRRGQLLVQLDDTLQQAQLKQAEAQAGIARTNLQRSRELLAQNFVSQSAVDQNAAALDVAMAQVALAQAQLARLRVLAPFDGVTGIKLVNQGDYVKDGADIVNLEDLSTVWLDFRLPERYVSRIRPGQQVEVVLDALPGRKLQAVVGALDAQLDANGRAVLVRARLANAEGQLRGGMFARARVVFAVRDGALTVPEEALVPQGDKQFVVLAVPGDKGPVSRRVEARIGQRVAGRVELLSGVAEGDTVVLAGQARLMRGDGLPLRVVDISKAGSGRPGGARPPGAASAPGGGAASGAGPVPAAASGAAPMRAATPA